MNLHIITHIRLWVVILSYIYYEIVLVYQLLCIVCVGKQELKVKTNIFYCGRSDIIHFEFTYYTESAFLTP